MKRLMVDVDTDGNVFQQDESVSLIPELWDVYKDKHLGSKAVRWIVMMYDYNSPYRSIPDEEERKEVVTQDVFDKKSHYRLHKNKTGKKVEKAIKKYNELQYDPLIHQYFVYTRKYQELNNYIDDWKVKEKATKQKEVKDFMKIMEQMEKLREERSNIKELILKQQEKGRVKGDGSLSWLEEQAMDNA